MPQVPWLLLCTLVLWFLLCVYADRVEYTGPESEEAMLADPYVYVVEVYSKLCGSCQEFAPIWDRYAHTNRQQFKFMDVNIDTKAGLEFAERIGALDAGLPAIFLFKTKGRTDSQIISGGEVLSARRLAVKVMHALGNARTAPGGYYVKHIPRPSQGEL